MNIQEVAGRTGLSTHTIRFYEKTGLVPTIHRSETGVRQFTETDVNFIQFIVSLRKTGMSLQDIAEFTQDGCILERLQSNDIPLESINRRVSILEGHREKLMTQHRDLERLLYAVSQKLEFYQAYIVREECDSRETSV